MRQLIRVAVVDDHPIFREGIVETLKSTGRFLPVGEAGTRDGALDIARSSTPDIMILDINIPGGGVETASALGSAYPGVKLVVLTASDREETVRAALQAGVRGYLLKGTRAPELVRALESVHGGVSYISPNLAAKLLAAQSGPAATDADMQSRDPTLSAREEAILGQVALGQTNKEIARSLMVSEKTVKHYMTSILSKLKVRNRLEAVLYARGRSR